MLVHNPFRDRQSKPCAARASIPAWIQSDEGLEDPTRIVLGDAHPIIVDSHHHLIPHPS